MPIYVHKYSGVLPNGDTWSFGWHSNTPAVLSSSHALAAQWATDFWSGVGAGPKFASYQNTASELQKVTTYQLQGFGPPFKTTAIAQTDMTIAGLGGNNPLPPNVAIVVSLRTNDPSRAGRGRMYLPAPTSAELSTLGELSTTAQTAIATAAAAAWTNSNSGGERPIVFGRTSGAATNITRFGIGTVFNTQQRRAEGAATTRLFEAMP